jgi:hypothetical protein
VTLRRGKMPMAGFFDHCGHMSSTTSLTSERPSTARPVPRWLAISRGRAFLTHLLSSAAIVSAVCVLVFFVWYPYPYFQISGAWNPLRVLIGVDLVLGPLLTLLLFKPGKKGLWFDLSFIFVAQVAAFIYGVTVIYGERPYFSVFAVDRFTVLTRSDVDEAEWDKATDRLGAKPLVGPVLAVAMRPTDAAAQQRLLDETVFGGKPDIDRRPGSWVPYREQVSQVVASARPLSALHSSRPGVRAQIEALPGRLGLPAQRLGFVPVIARERYLALVVDTTTGVPLEAIEQDPWAAD